MSRKDQPIKTENRLVVAHDWRWELSVTTKGHQVPFCGDKNVKKNCCTNKCTKSVTLLKIIETYT